jgi:hypothetical protein
VTSILQEPAFRAREIEGKAYDFVAMGPQDFRKYIQTETASRAGPVKFSGAKVE